MVITIDEIKDIGNTTLNTFTDHIRKNPDSMDYYYEDINYPISKEISFGNLNEISLKSTLDNTPIDEIFLMSNYMQYGDYDNSCMIERSNVKLFLESFGQLPFIFKVWGGYGSTGIAIALKGLMDPLNEEKALEIIETLNNLNDYPVIDDEDMSNMEYECFLESLDSFEIRDCNKLLATQYLVNVDDYDEDKLKDVLIESDRHGNPSWFIESGGICYIDTKELISHVSLSDYYSCLTDFTLKNTI